MNSELHSLLKRQMKRFLNGSSALPEIKQFIEAVDSAYKQSDVDRTMIERSLELSSKELLQANSELRAVFQALPDVFLRINDEQRVIEAKLGESAGVMFIKTGVLGKTLAEIFPEDVFKKITTTIATVRSGGKPGTFEYKHTGSSQYFEVRLVPYRGGNVLAIIRNITERKLVEEALRDSEQRLSLHIQQTPLGVIEWNLNFEVTEWNKSAEKIFGFLREEALQKNAADLIIPTNNFKEIKNDLKKKWEELLTNKGGQRSTNKNVRRDGREILCEWYHTPLVDKYGNIIGLASLVQDVTERYLAEQRIKEQAEFLDKAQDAITVRDMNNTILFWNKGSERLYGWTAEEVLGKNACSILCYDNAEQFQTIIETIRKENSWTGELRHATRDNKEITVESRWNIIYDDDNAPKSLLVINSDITEKKKLEAQFLRAQRMDSIGTLAGGIAHDINNILAPILLSAEVLQTSITEEKSKKILENIRVSARRGAELIKQVLLFARGAEGEKTILKPQRILHEIIEIAKQTFPKSIELKDECSSETWSISADSTQIHQVLLNLCVNSRDAMPNGGTITLSAKNVILDENYARMNPDAKAGGYVVLTVADTGIGIPRDTINKIFDPFFTTKEVGRGTGLGLSTVITIVKGHEGFITLESEVGKGSKFHIHLPADSAMIVNNFDQENAEPPQGNGELLLVVDDEPSFLEIAKETLELYGYKVITASDGTDAVAQFARHQSEIRLVITDMMMPYMDGAATIRSLRRLDSSVKIIAASGLMNSADLIKASGEEVEAFLTKPYTGRKLLQTVYQVLSGQNL